MSKITTKRIRNWVSLGMLVIFLTSLTAWFFGRDRLPRTIRIATGDQNGLYHDIGNNLKPLLASKTGRSVIVTTTPGSKENYQRLEDERAELGIIQAGSDPVENLAIITPLFPEFLFVIVRRESQILAALPRGVLRNHDRKEVSRTGRHGVPNIRGAPCHRRRADGMHGSGVPRGIPWGPQFSANFRFTPWA